MAGITITLLHVVLAMSSTIDGGGLLGCLAGDLGLLRLRRQDVAAGKPQPLPDQGGEEEPPKPRNDAQSSHHHPCKASASRTPT